MHRPANPTRRLLLNALLAGGACAGFPGASGARAQGTAGAVRNPMTEGRPSSTAHGAAVLRAAHQILDTPRVLHDPLALRVIDTPSWTRLLSAPHHYQSGAGLRAAVAVRSRYAEDQLAAAVARGIRQYVILGAGLDTYAYRDPHTAAGLHVFEVDHPSTQAWKQRHLAEAGIAIPASLTYAPVDFETQALADGLQRAGFNANRPAFFSLLGVVIYLTRPAIMSTLAYVQSLPAGSEIVFDYSVLSSHLSESQQRARAIAEQSVAERGEPWISYFDPPALQAGILELGYRQAIDLSPQDTNERYFSGRADNLRVSNSRLMLARV